MFGTCVVALGISDGLFEGLALIEGATDFVGTSDGDFEVVGLKDMVDATVGESRFIAASGSIADANFADDSVIGLLGS